LFSFQSFSFSNCFLFGFSFSGNCFGLNSGGFGFSILISFELSYFCFFFSLSVGQRLRLFLCFQTISFFLGQLISF
jgi:hypothetical protein